MLALLSLLLPARAADDVDVSEGEGETVVETVVVTAARAEQAASAATAAVRVLDRARLEASGATTLADVLRTVPGVQVLASRGGDAVSLRGMDPQHTLVLLDGRPLAGRVDGVVDLSRIALADVERVEILPGPASALYGSEALGGVVNLVTRRGGVGPSAEVGARGGSRSLAEGDVRLSGGRGPFRVVGRAYRNAQDGWDHDPAEPATSGDEALAWGGRVNAGWAPSATWSFDADGDYARRDTRGVTSNGAGAVFDARGLQETGDASLSARWWGGGASTVSARVAGSTWRQQYLEDQRGSAIQDAYQETIDRRLAGNVQAQWAPGRHLLAAGVDAWREALDSARIEGTTARRTRAALYVHDDITVSERPGGPRVAVAPGGRLDLDSQFGFNPAVNLALRVDPTTAAQIRVSVGQGYRAPDFKELYLALDHASYGYTLAGNESLRPERSTGTNLDARWTLAKRVELRAQASWDEVRDLIQPGLRAEAVAGSPAVYGYENVGRATVRTAQLGAGWVAEPVRVALDYARTDARDRDTGTLLDGRTPHRLTSNLSARLPARLEAAGNLEWSSARPYRQGDDTVWGPDTRWVDARLAWRSRGGMEVQLGARNLLDTRDDAYQALPPRTLYAGVRSTLPRPRNPEATP
jgi:outer membrane receptor for ferrienterochelin and colicins